MFDCNKTWLILFSREYMYISIFEGGNAVKSYQQHLHVCSLIGSASNCLEQTPHRPMNTYMCSTYTIMLQIPVQTPPRT